MVARAASWSKSWRNRFQTISTARESSNSLVKPLSDWIYNEWAENFGLFDVSLRLYDFNQWIFNTQIISLNFNKCELNLKLEIVVKIIILKFCFSKWKTIQDWIQIYRPTQIISSYCPTLIGVYWGLHLLNGKRNVINFPLLITQKNSNLRSISYRIVFFLRNEFSE